MLAHLTIKNGLKLAAILTVVLGCCLFAQSVDFERLLNPVRLAELLQSLGPWAPAALILAMATAVVIPPIPSLPLDLAAGAVFGPLQGAIYAVIGVGIGAIISFLIGRSLGREVISRLLRVDVVFCEKCSNHHLWILIVLARLIPVFSFDIVSYGAGLTTMSVRTFGAATVLGMIPPTFAFTYLGSSVLSAQWLLMGAACALVALFLLLPKLLKRHRSSWLARQFFGPPPAAITEVADTESFVCPACRAPSMPAPALRRIPLSAAGQERRCRIFAPSFFRRSNSGDWPSEIDPVSAETSARNPSMPCYGDMI
ncbi:MAG: TVP38/TMEM64 family protein [Nitrospiraceae bacterium]